MIFILSSLFQMSLSTWQLCCSCQMSATYVVCCLTALLNVLLISLVSYSSPQDLMDMWLSFSAVPGHHSPAGHLFMVMSLSQQQEQFSVVTHSLPIAELLSTNLSAIGSLWSFTDSGDVLRVLRHHGMNDVGLQTVFRAVVVSRLTYGTRRPHGEAS